MEEQGEFIVADAGEENNELLAQQGFTPLVQGGLSAWVLKIIAITAMVIDHTAFAFVPATSTLGMVMHFVGRITGPVMFYFIAEGYRHTRNANRYTARLGVFALVSYLPFILFVTGGMPTTSTWLELNVIYTLLLGLLALRALHEISQPVVRVLAVLGLVLLSIPGDWGITGVVFILVFDYYSGNLKAQLLGGAVAAVAYFGPQLFSGLMGLAAGQAAAAYNVRIGIINTGMLVPIALLALYNGKKGGGGRWGKWLFYIIYPAHLTLLWFIGTLA